MTFKDPCRNCEHRRAGCELQSLAALVHGTLTALHLLGLIYNVRRRNKFDAAAHALGVLYDGVSTYRHIKATSGGPGP